MQYSKLFGKTTKTVAQYDSINARLLIQAGYIDQTMAGAYSLLPLGFRVLSKIENIVREEMNAIGGQEIRMPSLHPKSLWTKTDRWDSVDVLFKTKSRFGDDYAIAPTHEETVTPLAKKFIKSYRDLPLSLYHITPKFRDEPRPKSGILRGKEFGMKDLYSFHATKEDLQQFYKTVINAYLKIFKRCGFHEVKITEASGGSFTKKFSHEFNVITPAGEVDLMYCENCSFAQNEEVARLSKLTTNSLCPKCSKKTLKQARAIEIGNIFDLGTRFSEAFDLKFTDTGGKTHLPVMGCYGIGTTRILGAAVEVHHDERGIVWPAEIAPFDIHLIGLDLMDASIKKRVHEIYKQLGEDVLFDDRDDVSAGQKFADADLIGIPNRLVVSKRTGEKIEIKKRTETKSKLTSFDQLSSFLR